MTKVIVRQKQQSKVVKNPVSGHSWQEDTPVNFWEVVGAVGVISTHKSSIVAEKVAKEWQEFYDKFNL